MLFGPTGKALLFSSKPFSERLTGNASDQAVVAYVLGNTKEHDTVEVSCFFPEVRWQIERPTATRFTTLPALLFRRSQGTFTDFQKEWQAEYTARIEQVYPKFYIIQNAVDSSDNIYTVRDLMALPGFGAFVQQAYTLDTIMGEYYIYQRK